MTPYVVKMMEKTFPSLNALLGKDQQAAHPANRAHTIRLRVQYRMNLDICQVHAATFYDYAITTYRRGKCNPEYDGLYFERLPNLSELKRGQDFKEYEVNRALEIAQEIQDKKLVDESGNSYTICILTPYLDTLSKIQLGFKNGEMSEIRASSIDTIQGCEENVIILTTSRQKCVDLNKCPFRNNVATSRAKDMLIIMAHENTCKSVETRLEGSNKVRHWGKFVQAAMLYNPSDARALSVQSEIKLIEQRVQKRNLSGITRVTTPRGLVITRDSGLSTRHRGGIASSRNTHSTAHSGSDRRRTSRTIKKVQQHVLKRKFSDTTRVTTPHRESRFSRDHSSSRHRGGSASSRNTHSSAHSGSDRRRTSRTINKFMLLAQHELKVPQILTCCV